jgi:hypothetical protein
MSIETLLELYSIRERGWLQFSSGNWLLRVSGTYHFTFNLASILLYTSTPHNLLVRAFLLCSNVNPPEKRRQ